MAGTGSSRKDECISDLPYPIEYFDFTYGRHMTYDPAIPTTRRCHCRTNYSYPNKVVHQLAQERDELLRRLSANRLAVREHSRYLDASLDLVSRETEYVQEELRQAREQNEKMKQIQDGLVTTKMDTYATTKGKAPQSQMAAPPLGPGGVKRPVSGESGPPKKRIAAVKCNFCRKLGHTGADCWRKSGRCLRCGSIEHRVQSCPRQNTGRASKTVSSGTHRPAREVKVPERFCVLDRDVVNKGKSIMTGTFISGQVVKIFFDPRPVHSFSTLNV